MLGIAGQYGVAFVSIVACAAALWFMYKIQLKEREKILEGHAQERSADRIQFTQERAQLMQIITNQHAEMVAVTREGHDLTRRTGEIMTKLQTYIEARLQ